MRLGCAVRILGRRGVRSYDARRLAHAPHLSVSLAHLHDVFAYLIAADIRMYRMAAEIAPAVAYPNQSQLRAQLDECVDQLEALGALARAHDLRLSFHAPSYVQLATPDAAIAARSHDTLVLLGKLLDAMQLPADAVIVTHVGGLYGDAYGSLRRWVTHWDDLPLATQRRLVLEHEDDGASLGLALQAHAVTGVPVVFDHLHWCLNNPEGWSLGEALAQALATWPYDRTPKIHVSSPRTELRAVESVDARGRSCWRLRPPRPGHHADFINPWEFAALVRSAAHLRDFDVMLEAKAGDLALLRLRQDLARYVAAVAAWLGYAAGSTVRERQAPYDVMAQPRQHLCPAC